jgi:hypothetical protein
LYPSEENQVPLVTFVRNRMKKELRDLGLYDAAEMIQMMLIESYFRYAMHDDNEAYAREQMAEEIHKLYKKTFPDELRIDLPSMDLFRYLALADFLGDEQYPASLRQALVNRIKLERPDLDKKLRQQQKEVYEKLQKYQQKNK